MSNTDNNTATIDGSKVQAIRNYYKGKAGAGIAVLRLDTKCGLVNHQLRRQLGMSTEEYMRHAEVACGIK